MAIVALKVVCDVQSEARAKEICLNTLHHRLPEHEVNNELTAISPN